MQEEHTLAFPDGRTFLCLNDDGLANQLASFEERSMYGVAIGRIHGYTLNDLEILRKIPGIKGVHIQDPIADMSALHDLSNLEYLMINKALKKIDVSSFPKLRELRVGEWTPDVVGIGQSGQLKVLYIRNFAPKGSGFDLLAEGSDVQELEVVQCPFVALKGLSGFKKLESLALRYFPKLVDISELQGLNERLRKLILDHCKRVASYSVVGNLVELRNLSVISCGNMESIGFCKHLKKLETIGFMDVVIEDGDLSSLVDLNQLRFVGVTNKKHYSHTESELKKLVAKRMV